MCFSASASVAAGVVLTGIGVLAWRSVRRPRDRAFAALPLLFAVQQFIEGALWLGLNGGPQPINAALALAYIVFAHLLWPVYVPLSVWLIEPSRPRRAGLAVLVAAGAALSGWFVAQTWRHGIEALAQGGHIVYAYPHPNPGLTMAIYIAATTASLLLSSHRTVKLFGVLVLVSFAITSWFYLRWLDSVWCFFAALLSSVVLLHFRAVRLAEARLGAAA